MRILITGATGFIGKHLTEHLLAGQHQLAVLVRDAQKVPAHWTPAVQIHDQLDPVAMRQFVAQFAPEVLIHLAARFCGEHRPEDIAPLIEANITFGAQLLDMIDPHRCAVVWAGTAWQHYGNAPYCPQNLYAATKQAFSDLAAYYVDARGLRLIELHLYDSYGPQDERGKLISLLIQHAKSGQPLGLSPGEQRLHLVHVEDVCRGLALAAEHAIQQPPHHRSIFRLPAQEAISLRSIIAQFNVVFTPNCVSAEFGKFPYRPRDMMNPWEHAATLPGWTPIISLQAGLTSILHAEQTPERNPVS